MKRLLIIAYGRLIINGTAGNTVMCGLAEAAIEEGWEVTYLGLVPAGRPAEGDLPAPIARDTRVTIFDLPYSPGNPATWREKIENVFEPGLFEALQAPLPELDKRWKISATTSGSSTNSASPFQRGEAGQRNCPPTPIDAASDSPSSEM